MNCPKCDSLMGMDGDPTVYGLVFYHHCLSCGLRLEEQIIKNIQTHKHSMIVWQKQVEHIGIKEARP